VGRGLLDCWMNGFLAAFVRVFAVPMCRLQGVRRAGGPGNHAFGRIWTSLLFYHGAHGVMRPTFASAFANPSIHSSINPPIRLSVIH
jgi:hypothetical protein